MRQVYLARALAEQGFGVNVWGLCRQCSHGKIHCGATLKEAVENADIIAGPVPFFKAGKLYTVSEALSGNPGFDAEEILLYIKKGSCFFAGSIPEAFCRKAEQAGVSCFDFMKDERVCMKNTIGTAEGMIAEAIARSPGNLYKSKCLVFGYGRCGSALVSLLKGFSCEVAVCEKEAHAAARAEIFADRIVSPGELPGYLKEVPYIFNTVPALVLSKAALGYVRKDALILDLASAPGGVDYEAASKLGMEAVLLPGLPGKYAPKSSGEILAEAIVEKLKDRKKDAMGFGGRESWS